jgi:hypothetical protein
MEELTAKVGAEGVSRMDKGGVFAELLPPQLLQTMIKPTAKQTTTVLLI